VITYLVQACAELVEALLATSEIQMVATSREAVRVAGETTWRVPSLTVPNSDGRIEVEQLLEYAARPRLLVDRIRQMEPDFQLDSTNQAAVAQICSRLDGIPLAIELAAAE
jgi:non-specific serine/threonine protein kinase